MADIREEKKLGKALGCSTRGLSKTQLHGVLPNPGGYIGNVGPIKCQLLLLLPPNPALTPNRCDAGLRKQHVTRAIWGSRKPPGYWEN